MAKAKKQVNAAAYDVILSPVVTEKSTNIGAFGKYVFKVPTSASKTDVKSAVEQIFSVNVTKVNTISYDGKIKRFKGLIGKRNQYKKAIVTLKEGQSIDLGTGV